MKMKTATGSRDASTACLGSSSTVICELQRGLFTTRIRLYVDSASISWNVHVREFLGAEVLGWSNFIALRACVAEKVARGSASTSATTQASGSL